MSNFKRACGKKKQHLLLGIPAPGAQPVRPELPSPAFAAVILAVVLVHLLERDMDWTAIHEHGDDQD